MAVETKRITAEEFLTMPADGRRRELIHGEIRTMSPAGFEHGQIAMLVGASLSSYVRERGIGTVTAAETGFILRRDPDTVRAPDVGFVSRERVVATHGFFPGAPDLAIEVVSPGDTYSEVDAKVLDWLRAGARMVIVIDPQKKSAVVHRSVNETLRVGVDGILDGGDVVPGWKLPLAELFNE